MQRPLTIRKNNKLTPLEVLGRDQTNNLFRNLLSLEFTIAKDNKAIKIKNQIISTYTSLFKISNQVKRQQ